jgi:hypothetical protein
MKKEMKKRHFAPPTLGTALLGAVRRHWRGEKITTPDRNKYARFLRATGC